MIKQRTLATILCISAVMAAAGSLLADEPGTDAKIDAHLIRALVNADDNTVPFFVVFSAKPALNNTSPTQSWSSKGSAVVSELQAVAAKSQASVQAFLKSEKVTFTSFWVENKIYIPKGTFDLARDLSAFPEVAAIIPEVTKQVHFVAKAAPAVPTTTNWNISRIGADQVWSTYNNTGAGIVVANIDTGVQYNHPALVNQYRGNLGNGQFDHSASWYDPTNQCGGAPCDPMSHGTHTMGTMVGNDGVGNVTGVAPGAKWISCKACTSTGCAMSALISCAQWALAPGGNSALRPQIINNSWGGSGGSTSYETYMQSWAAAGIFPAFSIGDAGPVCSSASSPGDNSEAFATGATDSSDLIAGFSSRGPSKLGNIVKPNLVAPGVSINSSVPYNSYTTMSGTSMASPHTAGTVALLWAIRPAYAGFISATMNLLEHNAAIETTTESCGGIPAGASPNNTYGYGRLSAKLAIDAGATGPAAPTPPTVTITSPAVDGQQFACGTPVTFTAAATDAQNGNLTSSIAWSGPGTPASATGGTISKTFSCATEVGNRTITAIATDSFKLSGTATVVVNIFNPGPPAAPSNLTATASGSNVNLAWKDNSTTALSYNIYRRKKSGSSWSNWAVRLTINNGNATSGVDAGVTSGTYQYYVTATNTSGASAPSNIVTITK